MGMVASMVVVVLVFVVVFVFLFGGLMWLQPGYRGDTGILARRRRLVRIAWVGLGVLVVVLWLQQR
jgi:hypothetical protein